MSRPRKRSHQSPPRHLQKSGKALWRRITDGWDMDDAALVLLESACEALDTMRAAQEIIKREGLVVKDRWDQLKTHPAVTIEMSAKGTMLRAIKALGLDLEPLRDGPGRPGGS